MVTGVVVKLFELYLFVRGEEVGATSSEELLVSFIHNWNCDKDERRRFQSYKNQVYYLYILDRRKKNNGFQEYVKIQCSERNPYLCGVRVRQSVSVTVRAEANE